MRLPLLAKFMPSPVSGVSEYVERVKDSAWLFQQAAECYIAEDCKRFDDLLGDIREQEAQADKTRQRIRKSIGNESIGQVEKINIHQFLQESGTIIHCLTYALEWMTFRPRPGIPKNFEKSFFLLVDAMIDPVEELFSVVVEAGRYYKKPSAKKKKAIIEMIRNLKKQKKEGDKAGILIQRKVFEENPDPLTGVYIIRLADLVREAGIHAEKAGELIRAFLI